MASQTGSVRRRPVPKPMGQQSILQQVQAATAAQTSDAESTRREALLQDSDLTNLDAGPEEIPPPAYGDVYGEIRNEKDGLGTSARVGDDGRVNIRINQMNRRLSQVFTPALRQQLQGGPDRGPPPPPYIPPSLGGEERVSPPPCLNVVIQVVGSRGDVQPFVALAKVLKETYGHRVRLATHPTFKDFVQEHGLEFFSIGADPSRLMAYMTKNTSLMPGVRSILSGDIGQRRKDVGEYIQGCWRSCYEAGDGMGNGAFDSDLSEVSDSAARPFVADCIIANPPSFAHIHCAEKLGIPLHIMFTMPYSPTQAFPHPLANVQSSNADPQLTNFLSYAMIELLSWQGLGDIINRFRKKCLALEPISVLWAPGMLQRLKVPHTYCWSPALIPKPKDWASHISIAGYYMLNTTRYTPAPELRAFLEAGPTPIYIGFGSIVLDDPDALTRLIFDTVKKTGQRLLLSKGWGGFGADDVPEGVFILGNVPHDWLFKQVSCVVHHGGAGTTAAGIAAARPTVIVPFFGDQPFWGDMVARAGAGPDPIPYRELTSDHLAEAINFCLRPESLRRAERLASKIAAERGSDTGAQSFHQHLEVDRLRCTLAPSRSAVWRVKHTKVCLSAFAACTLANANLLDFSNLRLYRPQKYETDEGPYDPISGSFTAAVNAFSGMGLGLLEIPTETVKAIGSASEAMRKPSTGSATPMISRKAVSSSREEQSSRPTSSQQSSGGIDAQKSLVRAQTPSMLSVVSSAPSNVTPEILPDVSSTQSSASKSDDSTPNRVRSRVEPSAGKDRDMLRHTYASKGLGRTMKVLVQSPMDICVALTKGSHNVPKLWGDTTVRPQEQVSDFRSGMKALSREFGFGFYDGFTGVVTQPWQGAREEGAVGFLKGFGKGIGGAIAKPTAGLLGVLGHTMKGIHKEVQKAFGKSVQSYIIASRAAQGYEEWLQSSDAEKQDIVERWKLIQNYLKKKQHMREDMMRKFLETQQMNRRVGRETRQDGGQAAGISPSAHCGDAAVVDDDNDDDDSIMLALDGGRSSLSLAASSSLDSLGAAGTNQNIPGLDQKAASGDAEEDSDVLQVIQQNVSQLQRQQAETAKIHADEENLRQAATYSEADAQHYDNEALAYDRQMKRAISQSLAEQKLSDSSGEWHARRSLYDDTDEELGEQPGETRDSRSEDSGMVTGSSARMRQASALLHSYDRGYVFGTTQSEFEAQQAGGDGGEKSAQEKTEEEIVLAYVKKQSLLEAAHHQQQKRKGKGRTTAAEVAQALQQEEEELRSALEISSRGLGGKTGEASGT